MARDRFNVWNMYLSTLKNWDLVPTSVSMETPSCAINITKTHLIRM